eukprot:15256-Prorocentrum_minimum.AAC.1
MVAFVWLCPPQVKKVMSTAPEELQSWEPAKFANVTSLQEEVKGSSSNNDAARLGIGADMQRSQNSLACEEFGGGRRSRILQWQSSSPTLTCAHSAEFGAGSDREADGRAAAGSAGGTHGRLHTRAGHGAVARRLAEPARRPPGACGCRRGVGGVLEG